MKRILLAAVALTLMSTVASAGTIAFTNGGSTVNLLYTTTDIGGGLTRYDVSIDDPLNKNLSYFLQALSFSGKINQLKAFGALVVDDNVNAATYTAIPGSGYVGGQDSFFFNPFPANLGPGGITDSALATTGVAQRTYGITAGTGPGQFDLMQVAQIVAQGDVTVGGAIARNALTLTIPGGTAVMSAVIPEPSSFVLMGLGAVGLTVLARRRKAA